MIHPAPKPRKKRKAKKAFSSVKRPDYKTALVAAKRLRSTTPLKKKGRTKQEKERIYGTAEKIAFVKSLPCAACGVVGLSEVAHSTTGGMGRKADAKHSLPLCGNAMARRLVVDRTAGKRRYELRLVEGCHSLSHRVGRQTFESLTNCHLETAAAKTELAWQEFSKSGGR